jgi:hypothetical protein
VEANQRFTQSVQGIQTARALAAQSARDQIGRAQALLDQDFTHTLAGLLQQAPRETGQRRHAEQTVTRKDLPPDVGD